MCRYFLFSKVFQRILTAPIVAATQSKLIFNLFSGPSPEGFTTDCLDIRILLRTHTENPEFDSVFQALRKSLFFLVLKSNGLFRKFEIMVKDISTQPEGSDIPAVDIALTSLSTNTYSVIDSDVASAWLNALVLSSIMVATVQWRGDIANRGPFSHSFSESLSPGEKSLSVDADVNADIIALQDAVERCSELKTSALKFKSLSLIISSTTMQSLLGLLQNFEGFDTNDINFETQPSIELFVTQLAGYQIEALFPDHFGIRHASSGKAFDLLLGNVRSTTSCDVSAKLGVYSPVIALMHYFLSSDKMCSLLTVARVAWQLELSERLCAYAVDTCTLTVSAGMTDY